MKPVCNYLVQDVLSYQLSLLAAERNCVMGLIPGTEWGGVDGDNAAFYESLGSHQLVVTGIVHDINDTSLSGDG